MTNGPYCADSTATVITSARLANRSYMVTLFDLIVIEDQDLRSRLGGKRST
jgi:hypothetical protein